MNVTPVTDRKNSKTQKKQVIAPASRSRQKAIVGGVRCVI